MRIVAINRETYSREGGFPSRLPYRTPSYTNSSLVIDLQPHLYKIVVLNIPRADFEPKYRRCEVLHHM